MQASVHLAQALLDRGQALWEQDRHDEATRTLNRLLGLRVIPADVAERAQFLLGDIHLAQGHYGKARRHLAASIAGGTATGQTHFLLACAHDWDDDGDARQAYRHYRRAVELDPGQPLYSSAYALERLRRKTTASKYDRDALVRLRDAFAATPDDQDVVYNYVAGLIEMGRLGEAELALRRARKRWPDHPAFESVWNDFRTARGGAPRPDAPRTAPALRVVSDDEPVILNFPAVAAPARQRHRRRNA
jgi:tetratricopeptide (TPR) repeat protein